MKDKFKIRRAIVASQIKDAMAIRGMSRKQLADAVGRRPSEVTKWLSGNHNFTIDLLSEISEAVGAQITGVVNAPSKLVSGYGSFTKDSELNDPSFSTAAQHQVGPVWLSDDCFKSLQRKAVRRGEELASYVKGILLKEAFKPTAKASDFCGIWQYEDFGMSVEEQIRDITSHRSVHRTIEEL